MSGVATRQLLERRHSDNPILRIEELRRFPLRASLTPPVGTTFVFRSRGGRLSCPPGGYTAGELLWRGPLVLFQVDLAPHEFAVSWPDGELVVEVTGRWRVSDPVRVVAERVADAPSVCRAALRRTAGFQGGQLPATLDVDGLHLRDLRLQARPGVLRTLLDGADVAEAWRADRDLARSALAGDDGAVHEALQRFAELNERMSEFLPGRDEPR